MPTTFPPSGLDRADAQGGRPGTPAPANSVFQITATQFTIPGTYFEEAADSPRFNFGEQGTVEHEFECDNLTFSQLLPLIQRGQINIDSYGNESKVLESSVKWLKGANQYGYSRVNVRVTSEGLTWGTPPDEYSVEPMEINPDLMKHPRYNYGPAGANTSSNYGLTAQMKQAIRYVLNQGNNYSANSAFAQLFGAAGILTAGGKLTLSNTQLQMAWEIIQKYYRGEDTFYLPAINVTYTYFAYAPRAICPGGFIDNPIATSSGASIPYFFWSLDGTDNAATANNALQAIAEQDQWNLWQNGVTFLRKADTVVFGRTWFKVTENWVGAPTGPQDQNGQNYIFWDPDIYLNPTTPLGPLPTLT